MKALCCFGVICSLALATNCFAGDGLVWEKDLDAAKSAAKRSNRLVLIHFGAPWCAACKQLEQGVFSQPDFGKELKANYVAVKLNSDDFPATAKTYGVGPVPCDVVLAPNGQVIERMISPQTAAAYVDALQRVAVFARTGQRPPPSQTVAALPPSFTSPAGVNVSGVPTPIAATPPPGQSSNYYMDYANQNRAATPSGAPAAAQPYLTAAAPTPVAQGQTDWLTAQQPGAQVAQISQKPAAPRGIPQLAPGNAPLALDGYCPVSLVEKGGWGKGDVQYGLQHRGRTYLFAGPQELERFRANPDHYTPELSGNDPVYEVDQHQSVPGNVRYGLYCRGRIYLFASEETLHRFQENQQHYVTGNNQARRP